MFAHVCYLFIRVLIIFMQRVMLGGHVCVCVRERETEFVCLCVHACVYLLIRVLMNFMQRGVLDFKKGNLHRFLHGCIGSVIVT